MGLQSHEIAQHYVGTVWSVVKAAGGPSAPPERYYYFPQAFDAEWIRNAQLPLDSSEVVHLGDQKTFERLNLQELDIVYAARPEYNESTPAQVVDEGSVLIAAAEKFAARFGTSSEGVIGDFEILKEPAPRPIVACHTDDYVKTSKSHIYL